MFRRHQATALAVVILLFLAGCTGSLVDARASPATVPASTAQSFGYVPGNTTAVPLSYPVGVAGVSTNVSVTSYVSGYAKRTAGGRVVTLAVLSTPNAHVAGRSVNPFAHLSNRELATRALSAVDRVQGSTGIGQLGTVGSVGDLRVVDTQERTVLGTTTDVVTYAGTATVDGQSTEVRLVVTSVEHGDDVVVALGVTSVDDETECLTQLIEQIEHDAAS